MKLIRKVILDAVTAAADYEQIINNENILKIGFSGTASSLQQKYMVLWMELIIHKLA